VARLLQVPVDRVQAAGAHVELVGALVVVGEDGGEAGGLVKAAAVALVANTAPVAFGAIAVPITTLGKITGLDPASPGAMVGRQTPVLAVFVPLILVCMVDGRRGVREAWLPAVVAGLAFTSGSSSPRTT
jgi:hypothetical protein